MIYTQNTKLALTISSVVHQNQLDKGDMPYIYHPIIVAENMRTEDETIVALLHDTLEDSNEETGKELMKTYERVFNGKVCEAIRILTKDKKEDYFDYIRRVKENDIAKAVKLEDLRHNSNLGRLKNPSQKDTRRTKKYLEAIRILQGLEDNQNVCEADVQDVITKKVR